VLIHAAAGGVGLLAVQWAKKLGATMIGTASTDEKARVAGEAGVDHVIVSTKQDSVSETKRFTGGRGAELILDGVLIPSFCRQERSAKNKGGNTPPS
jgi:NADPH:quinone reductase